MKTYIYSILSLVFLSFSVKAHIYLIQNENEMIYSDVPKVLGDNNRVIVDSNKNTVTIDHNVVAENAFDDTQNSSFDSSKQTDSYEDKINEPLLVIQSPKNDSTIIEPEGKITFIIRMAYADDDVCQIEIWDEVNPKKTQFISSTKDIGTNTLLALTNVDRGEHHFIAKLVCGKRILATSGKVIIYLHRPFKKQK